MKKQIRIGVFETNSSSTHSLTIVSSSEYYDWTSGKVLFNNNSQQPFVTQEEAIALMKVQTWRRDIPNFDKMDEDELVEELRDNGFYTYQGYQDTYKYLEYFDQHHTTKGGEELVAFGNFGHD
jgi:hypothetical protein